MDATFRFDQEFVVFDIETTGLDPRQHEIIEIAALLVDGSKIGGASLMNVQTVQCLIKPKRRIPRKITDITGITQNMVDQKGVFLADAIIEFTRFVGGRRLVAYNAKFDVSFIEAAMGRELENPISCALKMARRAWPRLISYKLSEIAKSVDAGSAHRALADSHRALMIYMAAAQVLRSVE